MLFFYKHYDISIHPLIKLEIQFSSSDYDLVLSSAVVVIKHTIFSALWSAVMYSSRAAIFVLYAYTLSGSSSIEIAVAFLLCLSCLVRSFWGVVIPYLCDKIGYDKVLALLALFDIIGVLLQAVTYNFWMLAIGYLIMPSSMFNVTWSYCAWILPYKHSVKYINALYATYMFLLLVGPILAGLISSQFGYRTVFYLNLALLIGHLIYCMIFIYGTQNIIENEQKFMEIISYPDDREQFPVLIVKHNSKYHNAGNKQFWSSFLRLSKIDRAILSLVTIANRLLWTFEIILLTFYTPYMLCRYNATIIAATAQLSMLGFGLGFGNVLVPRVMPTFDSLYVRFSILVIAGVVEIALSGYFFPNNDDDGRIIWMYVLILGLCVGLHTMSLESIILAIKRKDGIAHMATIKSVAINILKAFCLLCIGLLSKYYTIEWFWYILCAIFSLSFVTSIMAIILGKSTNLCLMT